MKPLRALVTNDDGIASEGLRQLALAGISAGLEIVVAAPLEESSGSSAALSAIQADGRVVVEERRLAEVDAPTYGVRAFPGFIALLASRGAFGPPPDLVLSGINRGANTGHAVLHSGTVGAALTGRTYGSRALAVSLALDMQNFDNPDVVLHWETAAQLAQLAIPLLVESTEEFVVNLNSPNVSTDRLRGLRPARLAPFGAVQTNITEIGEGYVRLTVSDIDPAHEPDSDAALLAEGYATVTLLNPLCERFDHKLPDALVAAFSAVQLETGASR